MGIKGLHDRLALKKKKGVHIREFCGKYAAVDISIQLFRGTLSESIPAGNPNLINKCINYVIRFINLLHVNGVTPICVFDGRRVPAKDVTDEKRKLKKELKRKRRRMKEDEEGAAAGPNGKKRKRRKLEQEDDSMDVDDDVVEMMDEDVGPSVEPLSAPLIPLLPENEDEIQLREIEEIRKCSDFAQLVILEVIKILRKYNVRYVVAPYEADPQLVYLVKNGIADFVISEDGDMVAYGCPVTFFKLDKEGFGEVFHYEDTRKCMEVGRSRRRFSSKKWDPQRLRWICITSGCDYLENIKKFGIGSAIQVVEGLGKGPRDQKDLEKAVKNHVQEKELIQPENYWSKFKEAEFTFLHQIVFDPIKKCLTPFSPYQKAEDKLDQECLKAAGLKFDEEEAYQQAIGNIDCRTLEIRDNYGPETKRDPNNFWCKEYDHLHRITIGPTEIPIPIRRIPKCIFCNKTFAFFGYDYTRHMMIHLREKPTSCPICPEISLVNFSSLKGHMVARHPDHPITKSMKIKQFKCELCNKRYYHKFHMTKHVRRHQEGQIKCNFCSEMIPKWNLLEHHAVHHPKEDIPTLKTNMVPLMKKMWIKPQGKESTSPKTKRTYTRHKPLKPKPIKANIVVTQEMEWTGLRHRINNTKSRQQILDEFGLPFRTVQAHARLHRVDQPGLTRNVATVYQWIEEKVLKALDNIRSKNMSQAEAEATFGVSHRRFCDRLEEEGLPCEREDQFLVPEFRQKYVKIVRKPKENLKNALKAIGEGLMEPLEASRKFDASIDSIYRRIKKGGGRPIYTESEINAAVQMYLTGELPTIKEVSGKTGISETSINRHIKLVQKGDLNRIKHLNKQKSTAMVQNLGLEDHP